MPAPIAAVEVVFPLSDLGALAPIIALALGAFAVLLADPFLSRAQKIALPAISLAAIALAALGVAAAWSGTTMRLAVSNALALGPFARLVGLIVLAAAAAAVLYSIDYVRRMGLEIGEYFGLLLLAAAGMLYLVAANDLVSIFIAFELMSLTVYAMVGMARGDRRSAEGAMKYFVLGAFSSAFLLYGLALLYGATGTIYLDKMQAAGTATVLGSRLALVGIALLMVGFAFKVGAVPFHAWIPDAYQGAPAAVTGFMAVAVKSAAFGILFRVLYATRVFEMPNGAGIAVLWVLAAATMILGNVAALTQSNVKRLLAYSGIAHSGYVLTGIAAAGGREGAAAAALFYLIGYAAMTAGAFAVLTLLRREGRDVEDVDDLCGLARERPGAALAMTIFMVSLVGIPPTAGFMGKLWVFKEAIQAGYTGLVVIAILTTVVSIYYYLRVVVVMYMEEPAAPVAEPVSAATSRSGTSQWGGSFAVAVAAIATILIGIAPSIPFEAALRSIRTLAGGPP